MISYGGGAQLSEDGERVGSRDPYAPPASDLDVALGHSWEGASDAGFGTQTLLVQALTGVLGLQALLQGINAVACLLLASGMIEVGHTLRLVGISGAIVKAYPFAYFVGIIPFAFFLVGANKNARAFAAADTENEPASWGDQPELWGDPERPRDGRRLSHALAISGFSPASMFWWFCVPFLSFVRPYQAVKAVWDCSASERGGLNAAHNDVLWTWWTAWLLSLFVSRASTAISALDLGVAARDLVIACGSLLTVAACLLALRMVRALHDRQRQRAAELWT
jgi:uncharacterized protein DUF4328